MVFSTYTGSALAYSWVMASLGVFSPTNGPCRKQQKTLAMPSFLQSVHSFAGLLLSSGCCRETAQK